MYIIARASHSESQLMCNFVIISCPLAHFLVKACLCLLSPTIRCSLRLETVGQIIFVLKNKHTGDQQEERNVYNRKSFFLFRNCISFIVSEIIFLFFLKGRCMESTSSRKPLSATFFWWFAQVLFNLINCALCFSDSGRLKSFQKKKK